MPIKKCPQDFQPGASRTALTRALFVREGADDDQQNDTDHRVTFSFSSENPVDRWDYNEVLDHDTKSIRLGQRQESMPLLFNHDRDALIGVVEKVWLGDDRRLYCTARFSDDDVGARYERLVRDGILTNVSFMYQVYDYDEMPKNERQNSGLPTFRATDWEPFEVSFVTIPADSSVGMGRAFTHSTEGDNARSAQINKDSTMSENRDDILRAERQRAAEIDAVCSQHAMDAAFRNHALETGMTVDQVRAAILDKIQQRHTPAGNAGLEADLDVSDRRSYSLLRALNCLKEGRQVDGLEREVSDELQKRYKLNGTSGIYIPTNLASRAWTKPDAMIGTDHLSDEFVSYLRERSVLVGMGARVVSGLVGNVEIPVQTGGATVHWGKDADIDVSEAAFDSVKMEMRQAGALMTIPRSMLIQSSPDIEAVLRDDLFNALAAAVDEVAIYGDGSDKPKGLLKLDGIGKVEIGTNGGLLTWDHIVDLETKVRAAKVRTGSFGYLVNPTTQGYLKKLVDAQGRPLWQTSLIDGQPDRLNGYAIADSTVVPSNLTKGTATSKCSAVIFGAWDNLLIGEWSAVEIAVNPYGAAFKSGGMEIRAIQNVDTCVRRKEAFAAVQDFDPTASKA